MKKFMKIFTPFISGYLVGYLERNYTWNKALDKKFKYN